MTHFPGTRRLLAFLRSFSASIPLFYLITAADGEPLLVSAAASLTDALQEVARLDKAAALGEITYNFGGSGTLQRQIENGAPVDVFVSAAAEPMDFLEKQNLLLLGSRKNLLSNTLVLIAPSERRDVRGFADLAKKQVKHIAIGEPRTVPAGLYATECLTNQGLLAAIESKLVRLLNVRQVLAAVETGNADAGFVYKTDAANSKKVTRIANAPPGSHQPIAYPVAIVRSSKNPETAQSYIELLKSEGARMIFEKHGFTVAP
jgi:molybdate transport system substrate-binding protein